MYVYIGHAQDKGFVGKPEGLEELGIDGRNLLKWVLMQEGGSVWSKFVWPSVGASDWRLRTR